MQKHLVQWQTNTDRIKLVLLKILRKQNPSLPCQEETSPNTSDKINNKKNKDRQNKNTSKKPKQICQVKDML